MKDKKLPTKKGEIPAQALLDIGVELEKKLEVFTPEQAQAVEYIQGGMDVEKALVKAGVGQVKAFFKSAKLAEVLELLTRQQSLLHGIPIAQKRAKLLEIIEMASDKESKLANLSASVSAMKLLSVLDKNIESGGSGGSPQVILNISGLPSVEAKVINPKD